MANWPIYSDCPTVDWLTIESQAHRIAINGPRIRLLFTVQCLMQENEQRLYRLCIFKHFGNFWFCSSHVLKMLRNNFHAFAPAFTLSTRRQTQNAFRDKNHLQSSDQIQTPITSDGSCRSLISSQQKDVFLGAATGRLLTGKHRKSTCCRRWEYQQIHPVLSIPQRYLLCKNTGIKITEREREKEKGEWPVGCAGSRLENAWLYGFHACEQMSVFIIILNSLKTYIVSKNNWGKPFMPCGERMQIMNNWNE